MPEPDFARPGPLRRGPRRGHAVRHDLPAWNATDVVAAPSRPLNDTSAPVAFFGVPKAATRSFIQDATNIFGAELVMGGAHGERCSYRQDVESQRRTLTMVREPVSLVQALYYHCATGENEFLGGQSKKQLPSTFEEWVEDWAGAVDAALAANAAGRKCPANIKHRFMPCVDPVDTLTYALTCRGSRSLEYQTRRPWPPEGSRGARRETIKGGDVPTLVNPPDLCKWLDTRDAARAAARLDRQAFVGVAELYDESICVLEYATTGKLPDTCRCENRAARTRSKVAKHSAPHDVSQIGNATRHLVETRMAAFDQGVYESAKATLIEKIRAVEAKTGAHVLCVGDYSAEALRATARASERAAELADFAAQDAEPDEKDENEAAASSSGGDEEPAASEHRHHHHHKNSYLWLPWSW